MDKSVKNREKINFLSKISTKIQSTDKLIAKPEYKEILYFL